MQDGPKADWSISYVSVAFLPSLEQNFIEYRSSKVPSRPDCIFEIHHLWQSGFSRVYSYCCCSCSFEPEIIKIGQSSYKMYSNNILKFQESTTVLNACTKKSENLLNASLTHTHIYMSVYICIYIYMSVCIYIYMSMSIYIYIYISSSSCRAASTDILDHLSPLLPIIHRLQQVFWVTSCVLT